jgi:hypothetical protein
MLKLSIPTFASYANASHSIKNGAKFEHFSGNLNTDVDKLSRLEMMDNLPNDALSEISAIDELDHNANTNFPLSMALLKTEQDGGEKLQAILSKPSYKTRISTMTFGNIAVHTIDGKIAVQSSLQYRIIDWYHTNLCHPGVTRTINSIN